MSQTALADTASTAAGSVDRVQLQLAIVDAI